MSKATPRNGKKISPATKDHDIGLLDLLRAILAISRSGEPTDAVTRAPGGGAEQVVIDTDVDGDRYVLIRMPQVARKSLPLSPRELEIVRMVAQGHPNKIIAVVLNISSWTVCTHLRRIFAKLGVSSRAAMVARLIEFGVPPEPAAGMEHSILHPAAGALVRPQPHRGAYAAESGPPAPRRAALAPRPTSHARVKLRLPAGVG